MERSKAGRRRLVKAAAAASAIGAAVLIAMASYASMHPQVVPLMNGGPDPQVAAENSGAVMWPVLVALLALAACLALLIKPGRLSYVASGASNVLMVGFGLTLPWWLVALAPLGLLLGTIGAVGVLASTVGWAMSTPLGEVPPHWPTHHEVG
jgi:hypothetical protein